jgi:hypothetical protein
MTDTPHDEAAGPDDPDQEDPGAGPEPEAAHDAPDHPDPSAEPGAMDSEEAATAPREPAPPVSVPRGVLIGVGAVLVLVVLVLGAVIVVQAKDKSSSPSPTPSSSADASLPTSGPGVYDDFHRDDSTDSLGSSTNGNAWQTVGGVWGIDADQAYVVAAGAAGTRPLAVADMGAADGRIRFTMSAVGNKSGIVFRFKDDKNYWTLEAVPGLATWNIRRTVDGTAQGAGNVGVSPTSSGTTVEIYLRGDSMDFYVNDVYRTTVTDPAGADATKVGLAGDAGATARWSLFSAAPRIKPTPPKGGGGTGTSSSTTTSAP